jgi:hypothetical protein
MSCAGPNGRKGGIGRRRSQHQRMTAVGRLRPQPAGTNCQILTKLMKSDAWYPNSRSARGGQRSFAATRRGDGVAPIAAIPGSLSHRRFRHKAVLLQANPFLPALTQMLSLIWIKSSFMRDQVSLPPRKAVAVH